MKYFIVFLLFSFFISLNSTAQTQTNSGTQQVSPTTPATTVNPNAPVAKWDKTEEDFGEIPQNVPKTAEFKVTNDGKEPLLIKSAKATCGCTVADFSKKPILPGKSSTISATYNAVAPGPFVKQVTVITNADANPVILQIRGTVK